MRVTALQAAERPFSVVTAWRVSSSAGRARVEEVRERTRSVMVEREKYILMKVAMDLVREEIWRTGDS